MNKLLIIWLILFSQVFPFEDNASIDYKNQNKNTAKYQTMKHKDKKLNLSAGIADSRTGMSFLGLSYKIFQKNNNETYIGLGTAIFVVNLSFGWKRYWSNKKRSPYTSFSIQAVSKLFDADGYWPYNGISLCPTISAGVEKELSKTISSQFGLSLMANGSKYLPKVKGIPYWVISLIFRI